MRTIAIEEHFVLPAIEQALKKYAPRQANAGLPAELTKRLADLDQLRLKEMDEAGIDLQVISHGAPAAQELPPQEAIALAREANDTLANAVKAHPDRFAGFATLPTPDPAAAAQELERAVTELGFKGALINGHSGGRFLDDPFFSPILEAAVALNTPIYLHPTRPPEAVQEAYYGHLAPAVSATLATAAWGWHSETALHLLRMVASGVFDRYPTLQIIIGHMGEMIPFYLGRIDDILSPATRNLQRRIPDYLLQNVFITTSGIFTVPPLLCALETFGADRIIFSVDWPFSANTRGRQFLDTAPLSPADQKKISHANVERLLQIQTGQS